MVKFFCNKPNHQQKQLEFLCLEQGCHDSFTLKCIKCINYSECKKHNWKQFGDFLQAAFEAVQQGQLTNEVKIQQNDKKHNKHIQQIKKNIQAIKQQVQKWQNQTLQKIKTNQTYQPLNKIFLAKKLLKSLKNQQKLDCFNSNLAKIKSLLEINQANDIFYFKNPTQLINQHSSQIPHLSQSIEHKKGQKQNIAKKSQQSKSQSKNTVQTEAQLKKQTKNQKQRYKSLEKRAKSINEKYYGLVQKIKTLGIKPSTSQMFKKHFPQILFSFENKNSHKLNQIPRATDFQRIQKLKNMRTDLCKRISEHVNNNCKVSQIVNYDYNSQTMNQAHRFTYCCGEGLYMSQCLRFLVDQLFQRGVDQCGIKRGVKAAYLKHGTAKHKII